MWVRPSADSNARPLVFLDCHPRATDRFKAGGEVASQADPKLLTLPHRRFLGEREHGVLLRVGRHHLGVVAGDMAGLEVTGERDADHEVFDLVTFAIAGHTNQVRFGLPVLVVAEDDRH